jgi:hypothetical protein
MEVEPHEKIHSKNVRGLRPLQDAIRPGKTLPELLGSATEKMPREK